LQVDEQHGRVARLAAQLHPVIERVADDVLTHLAPEQVAKLLALAQPARHVVETRLQQPDLAVVVDRHVDIEVSRCDLFHRPAHIRDRLGD